MGQFIDLPFADGTYRFALPLEQIRELQTKCGGDGLGEISARIWHGSIPDATGAPTEGHPSYAKYKIDDLYETIRQGLIGGGQGMVDGVEVKVGPMRANELIARYFGAEPVRVWWDLARMVMYACVEGYTPTAEEADPTPNKKKATSPRGKRKAG